MTHTEKVLLTLFQTICFCALFIFISLSYFKFIGAILTSILIYIYIFTAMPTVFFKSLLRGKNFITLLSIFVILLCIFPYALEISKAYKIIPGDSFYIIRSLSSKMYSLYFGDLSHKDILITSSYIYAYSYLFNIFIICIILPVVIHTTKYIKLKTEYGIISSQIIKEYKVTYIFILAQLTSFIRIYSSYKANLESTIFIDIVTPQSLFVGISSNVLTIVAALGLYLRFGPNREQGG